MRELEFIEVVIKPSYCITRDNRPQAVLRIDVKYKGEIFNAVEELWHSDAVSVLDFCFDRAKRCITETIKEKEADDADDQRA